MKYLLKRGRINRYEQAKLVKYAPGDPIELDAQEAVSFAALIGPMPDLTVEKAAPPVMRHIVPAPTLPTHERDLRNDLHVDETADGLESSTEPTSTFERGSFRKKDHSKFDKV